MGLYIEGMEMPKVGSKIITIYADGTVLYDGGYIKAVSVPEPHGDLIDANAVILEDGPYEYDDWCKWALGQYQDAPTVIPASWEGE